MRKFLIGLALLMAVAVATPRAADAYVSVSIGLPGFGFYIPAPPVLYAPAPVVYAPPAYYAPPVYYRSYYPRPVYYGRPYYGGYRYGRYRRW